MHLRHVVETVPVAELPFVIVRALKMIGRLSWDSLQRGDVAAFDHQAALAASLCEFGVCQDCLGPAGPSPTSNYISNTRDRVRSARSRSAYSGKRASACGSRPIAVTLSCRMMRAW
jgi:hypothetical protein